MDLMLCALERSSERLARNLLKDWDGKTPPGY